MIICIKNKKGYDKIKSIASFMKDIKMSIYQGMIVFNSSFRYIKKCIVELKKSKKIKPDKETRGRKSVEKNFLI